MTDDHLSMTLRPSWRGAACLVLLVLAGCASSRHKAPVEARPTAPGPTVATQVPDPAASAPAEPAVPLPPGAENLGKTGYYAVKPGDTLLRIALENGQNWRDVASWNNLPNPNLIEVGQVLRVLPPAVDSSGAVARPVLPGAGDGRVPAAAAAASEAGVTVAAASTTRDPDTDPDWLWPAAGPVLGGFDEVRRKGLAIAGTAGDPVLAAADGRVVYAGSGLRGYGNLIIVKHNATYLSAYAHNRALLVREDQVVRRGQKIAEMGSSDADRVQLHFEIRRQGKPIDPAKLLPPR